MRSITVAQRLQPFSHRSGVLCVLPGSFYCIQFFPTLIRLYRISERQPQFLTEFHLNLQGPIRDFTTVLDLEKARVTVWGETPKGYVRYHVSSGNQGANVKMIVEKAPLGGVTIKNDQIDLTLNNKDEVFLIGKAPWIPFQPGPLECLALGSHKRLDWDFVQRRLDLKEILPVWHRLGQLVPALSQVEDVKEGLLGSCCQAVKTGQSDQIGSSFLHLFQAGYEGILSPTLVDQHYQGFTSIVSNPENLSPIALLTEGTRLIRSLFVQQEQNKIFLLPALPIELHCGRFIQVNVEKGRLDLEWSKKRIRRLNFYSEEEQEMVFQFKHVKAFRLRTQDNERGQVIPTHSTLLFKKNYHYFFDNFI